MCLREDTIQNRDNCKVMTDDQLKNLSSKPVGDEIVRNNGVDNSIILTGRIVYVSLLVHELTLYHLKLYNKA